MIMKESVRSLRIYFIVAGAFNVFFIAKEMIVSSRAFHVGDILTFAVGGAFIYYGVKMSKYIRTSPKTLVVFTYIIGGLTVVSYLILTQWFAVVILVLVTLYLVYSIKKVSARLKKVDDSN